MATQLRVRSRSERVLIGIETVTGALAFAGGALLVVRPDGSLLGADQSVLTGSPFGSWLVPGLLLSTLVGGGFLGAALVLWRWAPQPAAFAVSVLAGVGLIAFETCELVWLGLQPLELVFIAVGVAVAGLGLRVRQGSSGPGI